MASPNKSLATLRPDLASFLEFDLEAARNGFIAPQVYPIVEVALQSDNPGRIKLSQLLGDASLAARASGASYDEQTYQFQDYQYATRDYGAVERLDERDIQRYRHIIDAELIATQRAFDRVLRSYEKRVADTVMNTSTWTGSALATSVSNGWTTNNASTATPIADIEAAVQKVRDNCGLAANTLILPYKAFRQLRLLEEVKDAVASQGAGSSEAQGNITLQILSAVFDIPKILVGNAQRNTSKNPATSSLAEIWHADRAMVCVTSDSPDPRNPCIGRTFHWSEDGSNVGGAIEQWYDDDIRGHKIRVRMESDEKTMYVEAGHLLTGIAAT